MAAYTVNKAAVTFVRGLIDKKRYVLDSDWGDAQPSADEQNAYLPSRADLVCRPLGAGRGDDVAGGVGEGVGGGVVVAGDADADFL